MDDILETNPFNNNERPTNTYGVQGELKRYALNEHVNKKVQFLNDPETKDILDDDLMSTNPTLSKEIHQYIDKSRFVKEIRHFVNIDSRNRRLFQEELVPRDPNTNQYTREAIHSDTGDVVIEKFTADDLNLELVENGEQTDCGILDPFIQRNNDIYYRTPLYSNPNNYEVELPKMLHNVKSIRLVSTEIPNPNMTVNPLNNIILIDIQDDSRELIEEELSLGITKSIEMKDDCITPFFLVKIPIGNYTLESLLETIEESVNKEILEKSSEGFRNLFRITGNLETDRIEIEIVQPEGRNLVFHWRFWFAPGIPEEKLLYYMLGFPRPYERNADGSSKYVKSLDNLVKVSHKNSKLENINFNKGAGNKDPILSLLHYGLKQVRPYRKINLQPETYIYLVIEEAKSLLDLSQPSTNTFAKVQLSTPPGEIAFNTFVPSPKFYTEVIRKLEKLSIKWVDREGNLVDFHGQEHSFTLEITQYVDELTINNYSSLRGVTDSTSFTSKERIFSYHQ